MDLDGARNAKAEIFRHIFGFLESGRVRRSTGLPDFVVPGGLAPFDNRGPLVGGEPVDADILYEFGRSGPVLVPADGFGRIDIVEFAGYEEASRIAIGIACGAKRREPARLVLFGESDELRHHPVVERAVRHTKNEAEFVTCGPAKKLSIWQPPRQRPALIGLSVAHYSVPAGTLGAYVVLETGEIAMLSNNHVFANVNRAAIGDAILQPGRHDGGNQPGDVVGHLKRFVPIHVDGINFVDCAVATIAPGVQPSALCAAVAGQPQLQLVGLSAGDLDTDEPVKKVGRTTGATRGRVFAVEVDNYIVDMGAAGAPMRCRFDNQIQVFSEEGDFARQGDSGSLVLDDLGFARGLVFSGSPQGAPSGYGLTAINPINAVLQSLDARLWF
jgi:hypothetical protein